MQALEQSLTELIRRTSCELPQDVRNALLSARNREANDSLAASVFETIHRNIDLANSRTRPICQDTGSILFYVTAPVLFDRTAFKELACRCVTAATAKGWLRPNSVDPITGRNDGTNVGPGTPKFHFEDESEPDITIKLMLKGGGCENVGAQYSLPDPRLGADRNLDGCRRAVLDAVFQAQGKGCAPGVLGICIGGDRATGYEHSKIQFLRRLDDTNPDPTLSAFEEDILRSANALGIGPMGFGGKTTLLAAKACALNRLPASYFVTVSYMCWAFRRQGIVLDQTGHITRWLY